MVHHNWICCIIGPVIDGLIQGIVLYKEKFVIMQLRVVLLDAIDTCHKYLGRVMTLDLLLASVYDALLVMRASCLFRDGVVMNNIGNSRMYWIELPFHDALVFGVLHLVAGDYLCTRDSLGDIFWSMCQEVTSINEVDIIHGFAGVFLFMKSYGSCLVAEVSQLCYKGVLRRIALGSTDGLCCW